MQSALSSALGRGLLTLQGRMCFGEQMKHWCNRAIPKINPAVHGKNVLVLAWNMETFAERQACLAIPCHLQPRRILQATLVASTYSETVLNRACG